MTPFSCFNATAAATVFSFCLNASAQAPMPALAGDYKLASSTTVPASNWGYSKGRVSIKQLDERHLLILFACEWKREPKAVCGDHYFAQWHDDGWYLQDMNTDAMRLYFDTATQQLTIISRGYDAKQSVRHDIFSATSAPLSDTALLRRMKREQNNASDKENLRVFGPYQKWAYKNKRIEFQHQSSTPR